MTSGNGAECIEYGSVDGGMCAIRRHNYNVFSVGKWQQKAK